VHENIDRLAASGDGNYCVLLGNCVDPSLVSQLYPKRFTDFFILAWCYQLFQSRLKMNYRRNLSYEMLANASIHIYIKTIRDP